MTADSTREPFWLQRFREIPETQPGSMTVAHGILRDVVRDYDALRARLADAERERDELAKWKRETQSFARTFLRFGMVRDDEDVWGAMGGANQNYSYQYERAENAEREADAMRPVVEAARAWLAAPEDDYEAARALVSAVRAIDAGGAG
jgi:hypothetical protein